MPATISLPELPTVIQNLLAERQHHADALAHIDQILASVGAALEATAATAPSANAATSPAASRAPTAKGKKRRDGRSKFATSAEESILAFVKQNKNPTTQEIRQRWQDEGRGSTADNTLSLMVKAKKLKRTPLGEGIRGSRFTLA